MAVNILSKHRVESKTMYVKRQTVALTGLTAMALGLALTFGAGDAAAQNKRVQAKNTNKIGILTVPPKAKRAKKSGTRQIVVEFKPKNQRIAPPKAPRVEKPSNGKPKIAKIEIPKASRPKAKAPVVKVASAPTATKIVEEKVEQKIEEPITIAPKKTVKKKKIHKKRYHRYGYNHYDRHDGYHRGYKRGYDRGYRRSGYYSAPRNYRRSSGGYERCH